MGAGKLDQFSQRLLKNPRHITHQLPEELGPIPNLMPNLMPN